MIRSLKQVSARLANRLRAACCTFPTPQIWLQSAGLLGLLALISLPIGLHSQFLKFEPVSLPINTQIGLVIQALFMPAIAEELGFRVLLLPHRTELASSLEQWLWAGLSLGLFIVYHPLNGLSFFPAARVTFFDPSFLLLAALLGVVCAIAYLRSGSLWPSVVIHWLVVVVWLLWLGGYARLQPNG